MLSYKEQSSEKKRFYLTTPVFQTAARIKTLLQQYKFFDTETVTRLVQNHKQKNTRIEDVVVVDRIYTALFSALGQTLCART